MSIRIDLTPQQLKAFLGVAETMSFRRAAERSFVSQPALSRTIAHIEATLGARIFDRDTRKVALTAAGQELLPIARRIVAEFDDSFSDLVRLVEGRSGRVVLGTLPSLGVHMLPAAMARFRTRYPDVRFRLVGRTAAILVAAVESGDVDFVVSTPPPPGGRLLFEPLADDGFVLVCRSDDPLAAARDLPWSVFAERPFIATPPSSSIRPLTEEAFRQAGLSPAPALECAGELPSCGAMVRAGLGIAAVPRLAMCLMGTEGLAAIPLRDPVKTRVIGIVRHEGRSLSTAARRFHDHLVETARVMEA